MKKIAGFLSEKKGTRKEKGKMKKMTICKVLLGMSLLLSVPVFSASVKNFSQNNKLCAVEGINGALLIIDTSKTNRDTITLHGHPLGASFPLGWLNDSLLLFETGCCEGTWLFTYDLKRKETTYFRNDSLWGLDLIQKVNIISKYYGVDSLYRFLINNFKKEIMASDFLLWKEYKPSPFIDSIYMESK